VSCTNSPPKWPDRMVELVTIVFGVVVAESFARYSWCIIRPGSCLTTFLGLILVLFIIALSWVGYHRSVEQYPYKTGLLSVLRLFVKFIIVGAYGYLLYSLEFIVEYRSLSGYLAGFPAIFLLYIVDGGIRRLEYKDSRASRIRVLIVFFVLFLGLSLGYQYLVPADLKDRDVVIGLFLVFSFIMSVMYRCWRWLLYENRG